MSHLFKNHAYKLPSLQVPPPHLPNPHPISEPALSLFLRCLIKTTLRFFFYYYYSSLQAGSFPLSPRVSTARPKATGWTEATWGKRCTSQTRCLRGTSVGTHKGTVVVALPWQDPLPTLSSVLSVATAWALNTKTSTRPWGRCTWSCCLWVWGRWSTMETRTWRAISWGTSGLWKTSVCR